MHSWVRSADGRKGTSLPEMLRWYRWTIFVRGMAAIIVCAPGRPWQVARKNRLFVRQGRMGGTWARISMVFKQPQREWSELFQISTAEDVFLLRDAVQRRAV